MSFFGIEQEHFGAQRHLSAYLPTQLCGDGREPIVSYINHRDDK